MHHRSKHYKTTSMHPYSLKVFQWYQEHDKGHCDLGDLKRTTSKTSKQLFLIGRLIWIRLLAQVWTWLYNCSKCEHGFNNRMQLWNTILIFLINFQWWKSFKIQSLPHLRFKNYKINSKKSHSSISMWQIIQK